MNAKTQMKRAYYWIVCSFFGLNLAATLGLFGMDFWQRLPWVILALVVLREVMRNKLYPKREVNRDQS